MSSADSPPSRDELLAMAYVDGELAADAQREFEERLRSKPPLAREVAELKALSVLARQSAPPEPMDFEWERLEREWLHGGGMSLGLFLAAAGVVGLSGWGSYQLVVSDLGLVPKTLMLALIGGLVLMLGLTVRARLRTLPYDSYTKVVR